MKTTPTGILVLGVLLLLAVALPAAAQETSGHTGSDKAAQPAVPGIGFQGGKNTLDVEWILTGDVRFQDQSLPFHTAVADLPQTVDALVRVDPDDRVIEIRSHRTGADVGDLQL
ncbi:MAG: hypothetical protein IH621_01895, partial [Krumholzibacteria bacterium]|nr:hypothetical protein [Candidatus Krumholzibacteria bacterium]